MTYEDVLRNADSMNELRLRIKLESKAAKDGDVRGDITGLQLEEPEKEREIMR